jgi:hypothetical protein
VGRRETMALRMNEAFALTDREQTVVHTLVRARPIKKLPVSSASPSQR